MKRLLAVIIFCLLTCPSYGAFGAGTVWRISTVSSADTNGGAFDSGVGSPGTDESTSAGVAITITTASSTTGTGSPAFSATTHGPGNFVHIASGTGCTTGWHELTSQVAGVATFESAIADITGRTCVGTIGGPFLTIQTAANIAIAGNDVCVKNDGVYSVSSPVSPSNVGTQGTPITLRGYASSCPSLADTGQATIQASSSVNGLIQLQHDYLGALNFILDCNSKASTTTGLNVNAGGLFADNLLIKACATEGLQVFGGPIRISRTRITGGLSGCTAGFYFQNGGALGYALQADANACPGFSSSTSALPLDCILCISANNTGATGYGFFLNEQGLNNVVTLSLWVAYGNSQDGVRISQRDAGSNMYINCGWAWNNSGKSINSNAGTLKNTGQFNYNAYASGSLNNTTAGGNDVTLTADPSTNGASLNFALNSSAGGGALLKGACFPGVFFGTSTGFLSTGPIQPLVNSGASLGGAFGFVQ